MTAGYQWGRVTSVHAEYTPLSLGMEEYVLVLLGVLGSVQFELSPSPIQGPFVCEITKCSEKKGRTQHTVQKHRLTQSSVDGPGMFC